MECFAQYLFDKFACSLKKVFGIKHTVLFNLKYLFQMKLNLIWYISDLPLYFKCQDISNVQKAKVQTRDAILRNLQKYSISDVFVHFQFSIFKENV